MPLDLTSPGRLNRQPHYRRYLGQDGKICVVCVQDFDYYDYDGSRFVDEDTFPTSTEAETAQISTWQLVQAVETSEDEETRAQAARNLEAVRCYGAGPGYDPHRHHQRCC